MFFKVKATLEEANKPWQQWNFAIHMRIDRLQREKVITPDKIDNHMTLPSLQTCVIMMKFHLLIARQLIEGRQRWKKNSIVRDFHLQVSFKFFCSSSSQRKTKFIHSFIYYFRLLHLLWGCCCLSWMLYALSLALWLCVLAIW